MKWNPDHQKEQVPATWLVSAMRPYLESMYSVYRDQWNDVRNTLGIYDTSSC